MKVKKAGFDHSDPLRFTQGRWVSENRVSKSYLIYKWTIAMFLLVNQIISITDYEFKFRRNPASAEKYMIYATHWGFILIVTSTTLDAILVLLRFLVERSSVQMEKRKPHYEECHVCLKISIWLTATSYPSALFVTVAFWSFLYDYGQEFHFNLGSWINLSVHLFQTIVAIIDTFVSSRPWRLWHIWCPMVFGIVYGIFNILYILAFDGTDPYGNDYVYDILDWNNNPGMSIAFVCGTVVVFPILVGIFYYLAKLRDHIWSQYYNSGDSEEHDVPTIIGSRSNSKGSKVYSISIKLQDQ